MSLGEILLQTTTDETSLSDARNCDPVPASGNVSEKPGSSSSNIANESDLGFENYGQAGVKIISNHFYGTIEEEEKKEVCKITRTMGEFQVWNGCLKEASGADSISAK